MIEREKKEKEKEIMKDKDRVKERRKGGKTNRLREQVSKLLFNSSAFSRLEFNYSRVTRRH